MKDKLFIFCQYVLPKKLLTRVLGCLASLKGGWLTHQVIRAFVKKYQVDLSEAEREQVTDYYSFNDFFTRTLKADSRPLADSGLISPVDGRISQLGAIKESLLMQAKGKHYSLEQLLAGDDVTPFKGGSFATLYLSPRDYHRIHMPCSGTLTRMVHVPGDLFSVNPVTAQNIDGLFARNERVICYFESSQVGRFAMVLVGATVVGSIKTAWHGVVNHKRPGHIRYWNYDHQPLVLYQGQEMGQFLLGSTVILVFEPGAMDFVDNWQANTSIKMGEAMGELLLPDTKTRENLSE
ncbi:MAG TPA: archaetidylserine decarboxylase [Paenalcaligenes sp.]|nr:archaetidylserine decarboxylase [Paenalcaligenes sp.]